METQVPAREARAVTKYLRISPRKVRLVINTIRHKPVGQAFGILSALNKKAARLVEQTLKSAAANAKGKQLDEPRLVVGEVRADGGPVMKRHMERSMGRADENLKRMTHLTLVLRETEKPFKPVLPTKGKSGEAEKEAPKKKFKIARAGQKKKTQTAAGKA